MEACVWPLSTMGARASWESTDWRYLFELPGQSLRGSKTKKASAPRADAHYYAASFVTINFGNVDIVYHGRRSLSMRSVIR